MALNLGNEFTLKIGAETMKGIDMKMTLPNFSKEHLEKLMYGSGSKAPIDGMLTLPMVQFPPKIDMESVILHSPVQIMTAAGMGILQPGTTLYRAPNGHGDLQANVDKLVGFLNKEVDSLRSKVVTFEAKVAESDSMNKLHLEHIEELMGKMQHVRDSLETMRDRFNDETGGMGVATFKVKGGKEEALLLQATIAGMVEILADTMSEVDAVVPKNHITLSKAEVEDLYRMTQVSEDEKIMVSVLDCPETGLYDDETGEFKKSRLVGYYTDDLEAGVVPLGQCVSVKVEQ